MKLSTLASIASVAVLASFAVSCDLSSSYSIVGNKTFVNNYSGKIMSDEGTEYTSITNRNKFPQIDSCARSYIVCNMQGSSKDGSSITLTEVHPAAIIEPDKITEPDSIAYEPTKLSGIWLSGGYLNVIIKHCTPTEDNPMELKLTEIDSLYTEDRPVFELRLTSKTPVARTYNSTSSVSYTTYATFPLYQKYLLGKSQCFPTVTYRWFKKEVEGNNEIVAETVYGTWSVGGYIQPALQ